MSATQTGSRRGSRGTSPTSSRRFSAGPRSRRPTSRPRTSTSATAIPTAARSRSTRTSSGGRSPRSRATGRRSRGLAHRGEHSSRPRSRRRLGRARRAATAPAVAGETRAGPRPPLMPRFSISQITTVGQSFADDLDAYAAAGAAGDRDLGDEARRRLARALPGERASGRDRGPRGAVDPSAAADGGPCRSGRARSRRSRRGSSGSRPSSRAACSSSPGRERSARQCSTASAQSPTRRPARSTRRTRADPAGVRRASGRSPTSLDEAAALLDEAGRPDVGLMYDSWHLWNQPLEQIERHRERILGVHVADWRDPTRNTNDRVLPGDGVIDFGPIVDALRWDGLYDLEIFSDPELPDSLWKDDPRELARRGVEALSQRVCVVGGGVIGSLYAAHLARVADVSVLCRRPEHARSLNAERPAGLGPARVRGGGLGRDEPGRASRAGPRDRRDQDDGARRGRGPARRPLARGARHDRPERPRRRGGRPAARRLAPRLGGHLHERDAALRHSRRVHPRHGDLARPLRRHAVRPRRGHRRAARAVDAEGPGVRRPQARPVVEADLQLDGQLRRGAHRSPTRPALRGARAPRSARPPRPRPHGGGEAGRRGGRGRAARGPVGDERARDEARQPALPVHARRRRGPPPDGGRPDHRRPRPGSRAARCRRFPCRPRCGASSRRARLHGYPIDRRRP